MSTLSAHAIETPIQLIVGLSNPGAEYAKTRHNAGAWLVESLADSNDVVLRVENKFQGRVGAFQSKGATRRLLIPGHYMNQNGLSISLIAQFFNIPPQAILVAHDELDFPAGIIRLKQGGGHGGHNGLRNVIQQLHSNEFSRIRIGIGHPGDRNQVHDYVLGKPSQQNYQQIMDGIIELSAWMDKIINGHMQEAMKALHS